jgi:hypothetical protein
MKSEGGFPQGKSGQNKIQYKKCTVNVKSVLHIIARGGRKEVVPSIYEAG